MNILFLWLIISLLTNSTVAAKHSKMIADSIAPDYNQAVDLCLFHRFAEAEVLLKQLSCHTGHPNRDDARSLLLEDIYFRRNQYKSYIHFCDSTGQAGPNSGVSRFLAGRLAPKFILLTDSVQIPLRVKKWAIVNVLVNGKPYRFTLDTGAERTVVSKRLANELQLPHLFDTSVRNILNQTIPADLNQVDTLRMGELIVTNLPVWQTSMAGFPVDGLLGWDVLQKFTFTIDYSGQQLVLRKPVARSDVSRNLLGIGRPLLAFHSETGNQLNLLLDTGSNDDISLTPIGLTKIGPYQTGHRLGLQLGVGGHFRINWERTVKRARIHIDKQSVVSKKTHVERNDEVICSILKDGSVGSRQFRRGRLTVDYLNNHFDYCE